MQQPEIEVHVPQELEFNPEQLTPERALARGIISFFIYNIYYRGLVNRYR